MVSARGAYFRALVETAQVELGGKADQAAQVAAVKAVHRKFYPVVQEAIATDDILLSSDVPRKRLALERNRRLNFARSSYGTIQKWLRVEGHDLMKLDALKVSKSQLEKDTPPTAIRKHALTPERVNNRAHRLIGGLLGFTRQVAKSDPELSQRVVNAAIDQLMKFLVANAKATTDTMTAANEQRPLRVGGRVFWLTETRKTA